MDALASLDRILRFSFEACRRSNQEMFQDNYSQPSRNHSHAIHSSDFGKSKNFSGHLVLGTCKNSICKCESHRQYLIRLNKTGKMMWFNRLENTCKIFACFQSLGSVLRSCCIEVKQLLEGMCILCMCFSFVACVCILTKSAKARAAAKGTCQRHLIAYLSVGKPSHGLCESKEMKQNHS